MRTVEVEVDGGTLVAWRSGSGRPALLLHGGPGLGDMQEGLAAELDGLFECVRYNQRGLPPGDAPGPYSVERFVEDAIGVLDALRWESATIIGHSWGGLLAQHIAASRPERVAALIGIATLGGASLPDGGWSDMEAEIDARLPEDVARQVSELDQRLYRGEGSDADIATMLDLCWPTYFADPASAPARPDVPINNDVYAQIHASAVELFKSGHPAAGLRSFHRPALFVHGERDPIPAEHPRATASAMPAATFVLLERCGHFPWIERPGAVRGAIEGHLG